MSVTWRAMLPPGLGIALTLLIVASCAGRSPEPEQVRTTTVTDAIASGAEPSTPPTPEPAETATPTPPGPEKPDPNDPAPTPPASEADARVSGTVSYRERIALTPGATLTVQIRDTSLQDVASVLIAEQVLPNPGQVPIRFEIPYASATIEPRNTYSISARIVEADDRLAFINDTAYDVITRGNASEVNLVLVMVQPPPDMVDGEWSAENRQPVEAPVTVTGTEVIWEAPDAYVRVVFVVADEDGCYRRGREEATVDGTRINVTVTAWVPPPAPWAMDCSNETLELDAIAHVGDSLVSGETYTITVNGEHATTFTAP